MNRNDIPKAIEYYLYALEIRRSKGEKRYEAGILNSIGNLHFEQEEYEKALGKFFENLSIATSINNLQLLPIAYSNIASVCSK